MLIYKLTSKVTEELLLHSDSAIPIRGFDNSDFSTETSDGIVQRRKRLDQWLNELVDPSETG